MNFKVRVKTERFDDVTVEAGSLSEALEVVEGLDVTDDEDVNGNEQVVGVEQDEYQQDILSIEVVEEENKE